MNNLTEWLGKTEDITIEFDASILKNDNMLVELEDIDERLPVIERPLIDNIREVEEVEWDDEVKKADRTDYLAAIACGSIAGLIDSFFVGSISLESANKWGDKEIGEFVKRVARFEGYSGDDLSDAIRCLEKKYKFASDGNTAEFGGGRQHHLRDFSHHFSLGGLVCSLFTQFTGKVIGTDTDGNLIIVEVKDRSLIGKNFEEKILFGTVKWFLHLVSDMAGSNATAGKGTGIPGVVVSMIKELSALPCFRDKKIDEFEFHTWVSKLFNGTLLAKRNENGKIVESEKFDLRTEIGMLHELSRQFIPVLINECLVRGIYFIRRLYIAIKDAEIRSVYDLRKVNTSDLLPDNNRVIKRMITVSSGTFMAVDFVDAAVHSAIRNKGLSTPKYVVDFIVRVNLVGIGRFIVACKADAAIITEDIRKAKEKRDKATKEFEQTISDLGCLSLDYEQMQILHSIEKVIVQDDINNTKKDSEKAEKEKWLAEWQKKILADIPMSCESKEKYFVDIEKIKSFFASREAGDYPYLVIMEAMLFVPYYQIYGDDEKDKALNNLKFNSNYLKENISYLQNHINEKDFIKLQKSYKQAVGTITGGSKNLMIGAIGTTAAVVVSGGLAFAFAPTIAVAIVGESAVGLSGAALASYSLAAIGGGSLAVGGLGMAGGTMIITGGGALLGAIGGTGISAATTLNLLAQDGYVLSECCKLLTFSKEVLLGKFNDSNAVTEIQTKVEANIDNLQNIINQLKKDDDCNLGKEGIKERKQKIKTAEKSMKYLIRCNDALKKLLSDK